jgi:hypothetical protein
MLYGMGVCVVVWGGEVAEWGCGGDRYWIHLALYLILQGTLLRASAFQYRS